MIFAVAPPKRPCRICVLFARQVSMKDRGLTTGATSSVSSCLSTGSSKPVSFSKPPFSGTFSSGAPSNSSPPSPFTSSPIVSFRKTRVSCDGDWLAKSRWKVSISKAESSENGFFRESLAICARASRTRKSCNIFTKFARKRCAAASTVASPLVSLGASAASNRFRTKVMNS